MEDWSSHHEHGTPIDLSTQLITIATFNALDSL
jgi:hypothetical protein